MVLGEAFINPTEIMERTESVLPGVMVITFFAATVEINMMANSIEPNFATRWRQREFAPFAGDLAGWPSPKVGTKSGISLRPDFTPVLHGVLGMRVLAPGRHLVGDFLCKNGIGSNFPRLDVLFFRGLLANAVPWAGYEPLVMLRMAHETSF